MDWTAEQAAAGHSGQQQIDRVFCGLMDGEWLGWGPVYQWTRSKTRVLDFVAPWVAFRRLLAKLAGNRFEAVFISSHISETRIWQPDTRSFI